MRSLFTPIEPIQPRHYTVEMDISCVAIPLVCQRAVESALTIVRGLRPQALYIDSACCSMLEPFEDPLLHVDLDYVWSVLGESAGGGLAQVRC